MRDGPWALVPLVVLALACGAGALSAAPAPPASPAASAGGAAPAVSTASPDAVAASASAPAPGAASPLALAWRGEPLKLRAARLSVDLVARRATLEGQVELRRRDAVLRCPRLTLAFDARGQVTSAVAEGGITLEAGELSASAHEARFDGGPQLVRLTGAVQARQGALRLTAAAASIDLARQQLDLTEVEGVAGP
ncbi:MAG: hypothetical protein EOO75_14170 [Myxococcales bacterium]|nr:MAG: hypothetical protein EOO75_14170 [Myxococcales bacterium]